MLACRLLIVLFLGAVLAGCASAGPTSTRTSPPRPPRLAVYAAGERIEVLHPGQTWIGLPGRLELRRGRANLVITVPLRRARRIVRRALAAHARRVDLPFVPQRTTIAVRPVRQVLHNDCEATALSMVLAAAGIHAGQLELQRRLRRSGPLDPKTVPGSRLFRWGDPERGFVGRAAGGGTEGGFGVYEPPVRSLAARYGVHLVDLHGERLAAVRRAVLAGHPVLAWVGLAPGPYLSWLTPSGHELTVNLDEHAVAVVGAGPGYLLVDNPLSGARERWSDGLFSYRWKLLGRRALELPGH